MVPNPRVVDSLFAFASTRKRQHEARMFEERDQYLLHLRERGTGEAKLRQVAAMLLNVVRFLELSQFRMMTEEDLRQASHRWLFEPGERMARNPSQASKEAFILTSRNWLRYHGYLQIPPVAETHSVDIVNDFRHFLETVAGYAPETIRQYTARASAFLNWAMNRRNDLSAITLGDVDDFLALKIASGFLPRSTVGLCSSLRRFFRYAEARGLSTAHIACNLKGPRILRPSAVPRGPRWVDVRRLLDNPTRNKVENRAIAILSLCAIYGLRSSEVVQLKLQDFDWIAETFVVQRAKRGRVQQYPIQYEVGEAILRYLQEGRPRCDCRNLFVSLNPPYRPVRPATVWGISADRLKRLGIVSESYGGHALRHSCATELLSAGSSLKDIADFLGHRDMRSVCIYAKYDLPSLAKVAAFSLAAVR